MSVEKLGGRGSIIDRDHHPPLCAAGDLNGLSSANDDTEGSARPA